MGYFYEELNDQTFQKLAQALIVTVHPETVCLPVKQPDGGRDAFFYHNAVDRAGFVVFQVKHSSNPKARSERDAVEDLIRKENDKVQTLIEKGATHYYLVTNVEGTGHLDSGSVDKANELLTKTFGIPSFVWWRSDLDARLDNAADIKWSYPEICRATDMLQFLIQRPEHMNHLEAARAITAYIGKQHGDDRDVKFKQVELKRRITDLFVDIPIGHKISRRDWDQARNNTKVTREIREYLDQLYEYDEYDDEFDFPFKHEGLAAGFLSHMPFGSGVSRFVLEGAPGQGKSTVTQFLCQANRIKLLPTRHSELRSVKKVFVSAPTRAPFRVDLRDYAAWVSGRHPYAKAGEVAPPDEGQRSLESFLTMQIAWHSGGLELSQHDLLDFLVRAHSVVVLDGFDEVADIATRARVVEEICAAADRLDAHALSLQIIVTSRPAAFANSPGFPEDDWVHLELSDLKRSNIDAYQEKWSETQDLTQVEKRALKSTLDEKLRLPHLRDLARNPMQLAILLQLMHVQGAALPDKRTALYEEYMKIFLNREVEKKQIAGDHRELILSIHGLLAWVLQIQAETGEGSGSITMDGLRKEVGDFLASEEHEPTLADNLLTGTVERVGALVSRVQGTFEFEVQPLREYFAARHLHKTAPYSPPGHAKRGTRPDRFAALAGSLYWTNVTRFFCGFYDVGELPSLVDGLIEIGEKAEYQLIAQPRRLAMMLLGDYVFTQSPKSMRRLIGFIAKDPDFQRFTCSDTTQGKRSMRLPETAGGKLLFEICAEKLRSEVDSSVCRALRRVMARNADRAALKEFWMGEHRQATDPAVMLSEAREFELIEAFDVGDIKDMTVGDDSTQLRWLVAANQHDWIDDDPELYAKACNAFFNLEIFFPFRRTVQSRHKHALIFLTELLHPHIFVEFLTIPPDHVSRFDRRGYRREELSRQVASASQEGLSDSLLEFARMIDELMDIPPEKWRMDISPWEQIVDRGFRLAPRGRLFSLIAMISVGVSENFETDTDIGKKTIGHADLGQNTVSHREDVFEPMPGLVRKLHFAKMKGNDLRWWRKRLEEESDVESRSILLVTLLSWGAAEVVGAMMEELCAALEKLEDESWSWFWHLLTTTWSATSPRVKELDEEWFRGRNISSARMVVALTGRLAGHADRQAIVRMFLLDYGNGDWRILQTAAEWELMTEAQENIDWKFVQRVSMQIRKHGDLNLFPWGGESPKIEVPLPVAKATLKACERHSTQFVSLCERALAVAVAQKAPRVSAIAEQENWFSGEACN